MDQPRPILDGNVIRVLSRHGYVTGNIKNLASPLNYGKQQMSGSVQHMVSNRGRNACSRINRSWS